MWGCGFVEDGRLERDGGWLWRWDCGFGIMEVGLCCGFASNEREEERRREEIEK